ncbi:low temperature requirement protein A [Actinomadura sp. NPDC049382]|uniref:low temperature requirement protein A n=1 Tax=Actinomadura sp. NPDC049382 TaxID=3158220 RepID=UPI003430C365
MRTSDVRAASDAAPRRAVSPLELFFDLVFVFAVGQLAEHLHSAPSWRGAAETAMMLIAVLTTWVLTSFDATFLDITPPRTRGLVLAAMGLRPVHERPDPARVHRSSMGVRGAAGGDPAPDRGPPTR